MQYNTMKTTYGYLMMVLMAITACAPASNNDTDNAGYKHHDSPIDTIKQDAVDTHDDPAIDGGSSNTKDHGTNTGYDVPE